MRRSLWPFANPTAGATLPEAFGNNTTTCPARPGGCDLPSHRQLGGFAGARVVACDPAVEVLCVGGASLLALQPPSDKRPGGGPIRGASSCRSNTKCSMLGLVVGLRTANIVPVCHCPRDTPALHVYGKCFKKRVMSMSAAVCRVRWAQRWRTRLAQRYISYCRRLV